MPPTYELPLFPLNIVVCPAGSLPLRIFEARYLDMVRGCMRNNSTFGVVTVVPDEYQDELPFARVGTAVNIVDADVETVGLMMIRCAGQQRFHVESATQQKDGLIIGQVRNLPQDMLLSIPEDLNTAARSLQALIESFIQQKQDLPIAEPYQFDDCSWVANRWLELLDIPLVQKQRLMALDSPLLRLELIQDILTSNTGND